MICVLLHFRDFSYCTLLRIFPIDLKVGEFLLSETIWLPLYPKLERKREISQCLILSRAKKRRRAGGPMRNFSGGGRGEGKRRRGCFLLGFIFLDNG